MDDNSVPSTAWLSFALSQPKAVALCRKLRECCPDPVQNGELVKRYIDGRDDELATRLQAHISATDLQRIRSDDTRRKVDQALSWENSADNHHLLGLDHPAYPTLLLDTADAPVLLYAQGSLEALNRPLIAAVGSRKASHAALSHTRVVCAELAALQVGIVSGLARGIDAAAHEAALSVGGTTIAVAATAPGKVYPRQHQSLAARILNANGLILTEYHLGSPTRPWFFPQRNRIISGVSLGVLVAEASLPSGTLTTATHAMNQGREVMAVPGSVHNLQARGCHALIKQGAALVENTQDIVDCLGEKMQRVLANSTAHEGDTQLSGERHQELALDEPELSANEHLLLDCLGVKPASPDELLTLINKAQHKWSLPQLIAVLGLLEIRGLITNTSGGRYARCLQGITRAR